MFRRFYEGDPTIPISGLAQFNPAGNDPIKDIFQKVLSLSEQECEGKNKLDDFLRGLRFSSW